MALKTNIKHTTPAAIFGFLDLDKSYLDKFNLFKMNLVMAGADIVLTSTLTEDTVSVKSSETALLQLKQGKLGSISKAAIRNTIANVLDGLPLHPVDWDGHFPEPDNTVKVAAAEIVPPASAAPPVSMAGYCETFPFSKMHSAECIKLRDALQMYQPVEGTSQNSRYFVVALSAELKLAARWKDQSLSLRVEGPGFHALKAKLAMLGFDNATSNQDYGSMHLNVGYDKVLASRTLGAVVSSLGELVTLLSPVPSANMVKYK